MAERRPPVETVTTRARISGRWYIRRARERSAPVRTPRPEALVKAPATGPATADAPRSVLQRIASARPRTIVAIWLLACGILVARVLGGSGVDVRGDLHGLVPPGDRPPADEPLLLLRMPPTADGVAPDTDRLIEAASAVQERLGSERVALAPPRAEITGWVDAHVLYLLDPRTRATLSDALTDEAMTEAVESLRARLSSPLFGIRDDDPRRDPLGLQSVGAEASAAFGRIGRMSPRGAEATATGDLLARDGSSLLVLLRSARGPDVIAADVDDALGDLPVERAIVGPAATEQAVAGRIEAEAPRLLLLVGCGLAVVLALALRAIRPVIAILLALATGVLGLLWMAPPVDVFGVALAVLLCGYGCEGALHLQRISSRGWPGAAVMGTALLPLWLSPYPTWKAWSVVWLVGIALVVLTLRIALPALTSLIGGPRELAGSGFLLRPTRLVAVVLSVGALACGAWAAERLAFRGFDRLAADAGPVDDATRHVREHFFDPSRVVEAYSTGATEAEALERAAHDARRLAELVPAQAQQVDSPGRLVLPEAEIEARRQSLQVLQLPERTASLRAILESRGFRPDAFGEFLRSASELERAPTSAAALEGPLGHWIGRYVRETEGGFAIRNRVHLGPDPSAPMPAVTDDEGKPIALHGAAVAARLDRDRFPDQLGIWVAAQLWLGALFVWLGTRSLPVALATAITALASQTAVLAMMVPLKMPLGPHLVPALLLVGASALVAGARACRAVDLDRPLYAVGLLVTGLCQVVAGLALVASGLPLWSQIGMCVAIGASIASGAGLFVAPGLARLFSLRVETGDATPPTGLSDEDDEDDEEAPR